jgi:hypothetical protein
MWPGLDIKISLVGSRLTTTEVYIWTMLNGVTRRKKKKYVSDIARHEIILDRARIHTRSRPTHEYEPDPFIANTKKPVLVMKMLVCREKT